MSERPPYRRRATIITSAVAAGAVAATVGIAAEISHTGTASASSQTSSTATDSSQSSASQSTSSSVVGSAPQDATAVAGSNGS